LDWVYQIAKLNLCSINTAFYTPEYLQSLADCLSNESPLTNCIGFIDGTIRKICKPVVDVDGAMYTGAKKMFGLKYQAVLGPDGLVMHLTECDSAAVHDFTVFCESNLHAELLEHAKSPSGEQFVLYGDGGYKGDLYRDVLQYPWLRVECLGMPDRARFNTEAAKVRVAIEQNFGKITQYFGNLDFCRKQKLNLTTPGKEYMAGFFYVIFILVFMVVQFRRDLFSRIRLDILILC